MPTPLTIMHVDMDAFYAAVEQRDNPELRGKAVIVAGSAEGRGVVTAASYEAREFGVHSAMPTVTAKRLCPNGVFVPGRMSHYVVIAQQIREILFTFTPLVEPLSLDEAFLDVRGCEGLFGPAPVIARKIKDRIWADTQLIASVGVAPNKFLAKLCCDLGKPNGLTVLEHENMRLVLDPLLVGRLWGVGKKGEQRLHALGLKTIGDIASLPEQVMVHHLGEGGRHLWRLAQGLDPRTVVPDEEAKSLSTETTFARDIGDRVVLRAWLLELTEHLGQRIRRHRLRARTIDLKVRTADFHTYTRAVTLEEPTDLTEVIWQTARELFETRLLDEWLPLRLIGIGVSGLMPDGPRQGDLFENEWSREQQALDRILDAIRNQFGSASIRRAGAPGRERE